MRELLASDRTKYILFATNLSVTSVTELLASMAIQSGKGLKLREKIA